MEWISVKDREPPEMQLVFVNIPVSVPFRMNGERVTAGCDIAMQVSGAWHFSSLGDKTSDELTVSHWMPLPDPPVDSRG